VHLARRLHPKIDENVSSLSSRAPRSHFHAALHIAGFEKEAIFQRQGQIMCCGIETAQPWMQIFRLRFVYTKLKTSGLKKKSNSRTCIFIVFNMQLFHFLQSIEEWTADNVVEWMAVLNLYRYAGVFKSKDIKGSDLINLDREKLLVSLHHSNKILKL
jgi:hypothetical protein